MADIRWTAPYSNTLAFSLFKQHFEEINRSYWAFVPASNTIRKLAKAALIDDAADPKKFFLIPDEEDRRIASSYLDWRNDYSLYMQYSRLNVVMFLSSCFETYLRTITSLAFESKPGVIIGCKDSVDGASLLKHKISYGDMRSEDYRFKKNIDEICIGEWSSRFRAFEKYFGNLPVDILSKEKLLDEFRLTRNNIGHYIGRKKQDYESPIYFKPYEICSVSHEKLIEYFRLLYSVAKAIDDYMRDNYIGAYDVIKCYFIAISKGDIDSTGSPSYQLRKMLGHNSKAPLGKEYFSQLINFCDTNYIVEGTDCIFSKSKCICEIERRLTEKGIKIVRKGIQGKFDNVAFKKLLSQNSLLSSSSYSTHVSLDDSHEYYLYSAALIDYIVQKLEVSSVPSSDGTEKVYVIE